MGYCWPPFSVNHEYCFPGGPQSSWGSNRNWVSVVTFLFLLGIIKSMQNLLQFIFYCTLKKIESVNFHSKLEAWKKRWAKCKGRPGYKSVEARAICNGEHFAPSQNWNTQPHIWGAELLDMLFQYLVQLVVEKYLPATCVMKWPGRDGMSWGNFYHPTYFQNVLKAPTKLLFHTKTTVWMRKKLWQLIYWQCRTTMKW